MQQRYTYLHDSLWCSPPTSTTAPGWTCGRLYMSVYSGIICSNATLVCMTVCGAVHQQAHHRQAGPAGGHIFNIYAGVIWHYMQQRYTNLHDSLWCSPPTSTPVPGWTCGRLYMSVFSSIICSNATLVCMTVCGAVHQQAQQRQAGPAGSYIYMPVLSGIICSNATLVCMTVCGAVHQQAQQRQAGPANSYIYICRCYLALYAATLHWFA